MLRPQHNSERQSRATTVSHGGASSGSNSGIDFFAQRTALQHQQASSQHSIQTISEERSTAGTSRHPTSGKPNEGCSPDPQSSATTTGTTTTPTSVGNSSSTPPCEPKPGEQSPEFPTDSLQSSANALHGQGPSRGPWPGTPPGMAHRHGAAVGTPVDYSAENIVPYNDSPGGGSYNSASYPCAIKLLVSNNVAGSIIGRAGQTISELQAQSSTRIKLSQTGDYYPGSQDRVCLVQGQNENVKAALRLLLERFYMLQEHQHSQQMAWQSNRTENAPPFDFVVRILVPSSSCGMIIGKSGSNIRLMQEASGVSSVRLSPKDIVDPNYPSATIASATSERVVTLTGQNLESCLNCVYIILDGMTSHPDICRYANMTTSYSRIMAPDNFSGEPPALRPAPSQESLQRSEGPMWENAHYGQAQQAEIGKRVSSSPDLTGTFLTRRPTSMPLEASPGPVGPHMTRNPVPYSPIFGASGPTYSPLRVQEQSRLPLSAGPSMYLNYPMEDPSTADSVHNSVSSPDLLALQLESMHLSSSPQHPPPPPPPHQAEYPLFPSQLPQGGPTQAGFTTQVLVPDNMIGSILGRGGRTLSELQAQSGTRIRISQRGEYLPGTRNRIVTVRGPTAQSVSLAQHLMSQRMILPRTAIYHQPSRHSPAEQSLEMMSQQSPAPTHPPEDQQEQGGTNLFQHHSDPPQQPLQAPPHPSPHGQLQPGGDHTPAT